MCGLSRAQWYYLKRENGTETRNKKLIHVHYCQGFLDVNVAFDLFTRLEDKRT